jgi:hypothetical protein
MKPLYSTKGDHGSSSPTAAKFPVGASGATLHLVRTGTVTEVRLRVSGNLNTGPGPVGNVLRGNDAPPPVIERVCYPHEHPVKLLDSSAYPAIQNSSSTRPCAHLHSDPFAHVLAQYRGALQHRGPYSVWGLFFQVGTEPA